MSADMAGVAMMASFPTYTCEEGTDEASVNIQLELAASAGH